ncbi:MAG: enoyl-CoA hydratase-related protein, partial [Bradyrhizobium sp.]
MSVRIEKSGKVWTVIQSRPEAKNAMDPASAEALERAFLEFDRDAEAAVAVLWGEGGAFCAGFDLKHAARGSGIDPKAYPTDERVPLPRAPM